MITWPWWSSWKTTWGKLMNFPEIRSTFAGIKTFFLGHDNIISCGCGILSPWPANVVMLSLSGTLFYIVALCPHGTRCEWWLWSWGYKTACGGHWLSFFFPLLGFNLLIVSSVDGDGPGVYVYVVTILEHPTSTLNGGSPGTTTRYRVPQEESPYRLLLWNEKPFITRW